MPFTKRTRWRICVLLVILLMILTFTPLVIPQGVYRPRLFGLPYSLWLSGIITILLVVLTYLGSRVHPGSDEEEDAQ
jgi:hypothetical protein